MPSWKKILVSGSNISQITNDSGYAKTGSANTFYADQTIDGNLVVTGSITALQYIVSSSVIYVTESNFSGSHVFGNTLDDTHQFTGSVYITGSLISPNITGSLFGTASYVTGALFTNANLALSASHAISSSYALSSSHASTASYVNPLTQDVIITGSVLMTGSAVISGVDYIDFDKDNIIGTDAPAWKEGRLFYDSGSGALALYNWEQDVTLNIGQEQWLRARNQTGVNIPNGAVVRLSGSLGDRPTISLAQSTDQTNTFSTGNEIIGMATHTIEHGTDGFVTTFGLVNGLDTSGFTAGDLLWVSQSAGKFTNVPPPTPYDRTFVGLVSRVNGSNGSVFMTPLTPIHFHDISSVSASTYQQGDLWMYRSGSTGQANAWINTKHLTGSYTITGSLVLSGSLITNDGLSVQTITASYISASSGITGSLYGTALSASYYGGALSNAQLPSQINVTGVTASFTGSLVGSLTGTASYATNAATASFLPIATYQITASWAQSSSQALTASYTPNAIVTASVSSNTLTFTKGNGNTFNLTVNTGSGGGTPGGAVSTIQFNSASAFSGSNNFTFDRNSNTVLLTGSLIVSNSYGSSTLTPSLFEIKDRYGIQAVVWNDRDLLDVDGLISVNWDTRTLKESGSSVTLDWQNSYLTNGAANSVDWKNFKLNVSDGNTGDLAVVDWNNSILAIPDGAPTANPLTMVNWASGVLNTTDNSSIPAVALLSVDWTNRILYGTDGGTPQVQKNSVDWGNRYLYQSDGTTVTVNWQSNVLNDGSNIGSVDWESRKLYNTSGQDSVKWSDYVLYDPVNGNDSVNWDTRKTRDTVGDTSVDWENRILYAGNGGSEANQALVWSDTSTSNGVRLYGTASVALNVPKAGGVLAASFGGSPLTASVSFNTTMANYSVAIVGEDARIWTVQNIGSSGFKINSNSTTALTGTVYWTATPYYNP